MARHGVLDDPDFLAPFEARSSHSLWPEFVAVARGLKPVLRTYDIRADRAAALGRACRRAGLSAVASDFRVATQAGPAVYVYVSRREALAREAARLEGGSLRRDGGDQAVFRRFAELMGYPRCCADFFFEHARRRPRRSHLIEYATLRATHGAPSPYLNNLIRDGRYLISHYPCSYACPASLAYALRLWAAVRARSPVAARRWEPLLRSPVLKFTRQGVYLRLLSGRSGASGLVAYAGCDGEVALVRRFSRGDSLQVERAAIRVFRGGSLVDVYRKASPRDGVLFDFSRA